MTVLEVMLGVGLAISLIWWTVDHLVNMIAIEELKEDVLILHAKWMKCEKKK